MKVLHYIFYSLFLLSFILFEEIYAIVRIDIKHGNSKRIPVAYKQCFSGLPLVSEMLDVIFSDLSNSAVFDVFENDKVKNCDNTMDLLSTSLINYDASILYYVDAEKISANQYELNFNLFDVITRDNMISENFIFDKDEYRKIAHKIADLIYTKMTGEIGYFDTKIVHIADFSKWKKKDKRVAIMDYDGYGAKFITDGSNLVLTPRFSPNYKNIIYMAFDQIFFSNIYIYNVKEQTKVLLGNFDSGVISAPRYAPNGRAVLISRSVDKNTDIIKIDLKTQKRSKLTVHSGINTSASYSPNGKNIVFNSDRSGRPNIYTMKLDGSDQRRITFGSGGYTAPTWSPRNDYIAFTKLYGGKFYIGVIKPDGNGERLLTSSYLAESPSWAPNGRLIAFTKAVRPKKNTDAIIPKIYTIDITGRNEKVIETKYNATDPCWSY